MVASATLRPGPILGAYPQQDEPRYGRLEHVLARLAGFARQHAPESGSAARRFVREVLHYGERYARHSERELDAEITAVRLDFSMSELADPTVARAFALVREVAGRTLGMWHFDTQLIGGWVMLGGRVAEMQTGEGKTLTATLPACTAALAGIPVHVVTVNDYLVTRDAEWMSPIYERLGLSVGTVVEGMEPEERRAAYGCDVTYCTNKQLVFDYLKDRLELRKTTGRLRREIEGLHSDVAADQRSLLRGLCFGIIDEADSVLVDEARTPLIISRKCDSAQQELVYAKALELARQLEPGDFEVRRNYHEVVLTEQGKSHLASLAESLEGFWTGQRRREQLVNQALYAMHLLKPDQDYLVQDGKVQIIDEYTGRVMADRSWEQGLHQLVEAKEECEITGQQETLARISYQRFFRRYLRLGGMTGTAREVTGELWAVYRLRVSTVPTCRPSRRQVYPEQVHCTAQAKWQAVIQRIETLHHEGRPVLIGTPSVASSEHLDRLLDERELPHQVLNARQDDHESEIVAQAGKRGRITVATNMAGRGTDIKLAPDVVELGGLHVILTERHDARRIDRQLFGRCARQGDPGSVESIVSLEDDLITRTFGTSLGRSKDVSRPWLPFIRTSGRLVVRLAQMSAERRHGQIRRDLLKMDERLGDMLAFSGREE